MADNDNGKIEAMSHQLVVIQTQMEQMVSFMARQTELMDRFARMEEREKNHHDGIRRIWNELEAQDSRLREIEKMVQRNHIISSAGQWVVGVLLAGGMSLAVNLISQLR